MDHRISGMIKAVDGTPEQKDKLTKLAQAAMADMKPLREQQMAARKKGMDLLAAPTVDRNALEQVRAAANQPARCYEQAHDAAHGRCC